MIAVGLVAALTRRGLSVQTFKKGPDYIDPMWLTLASGRACRNLDPYLSTVEAIDNCFATHADRAQTVLVEANMGLHDSMAIDGGDSSAALAARLALPVILVIDARGMTRSVAPLALGMQQFDPTLAFAGVVLNHCAGSRHEARLRAAIESYTTLPVLGAIGHDESIGVAERHLGLVPCNEDDAASRVVDRLADLIERGIDVDSLVRQASMPGPTAARVPDRVPASLPAQAAGSASTRVESSCQAGTRAPVRVGIARDRAFGFYYPDDLDALIAAGAQLVPFDTLRDRSLPAVDALFIGGGFPELHVEALASNQSLRAELRERLAAGLPAYAECGGLMYLCRSVEVGGRRHQMVGAIPADVQMQRRPVGRGYMHLEATGEARWDPRGNGNGIGNGNGNGNENGNGSVTRAGAVSEDEVGKSTLVRAHEFHHSKLVDVDPGLRYAWRVHRGHGIDGTRDGLLVGNLLASYAHLRAGAGTDWPAAFIAFASNRTQRVASGDAATGDLHGHVASLHG